jgi:nuclear pore complex protein Nup155
LVQTLGNDLRKKLVQLTFHQLVCSEDGDQLAMRLISSLMEVALSFLSSSPSGPNRQQKNEH